MSMNFTLEDYLSSFGGVWVNAINNQDSDYGSYMSVVSENKLKEAILASSYSNEQWLEYSKYLSGLNFAPIGKLTGVYIKWIIKERVDIK